MTRINYAAYFGVHLILAILMLGECTVFLRNDFNRDKKVVIHVPLQIKHLTRTVVKVIEKPVVKEYKHGGEIIHHHRHSGHIEHDHSHDIRGRPPPSHEHRMDDEERLAAASSDSRQRQRFRYVDPATESVIRSATRPATHASRLPKYAGAAVLRRRELFPSANSKFSRPRINRDSYVRILFRSTVD